MKKKLSLPAVIYSQPRVKKIIQADKNIGKLASQTPFLVSKMTEMFLEELIKSSSNLAIERGDNKLSSWHL